MFKHILLVGLLIIEGFSQVTLHQIEQRPAGRAKNFLIWQYFSQNITPKEADEAFYQIDNVDMKLFYAYAQKTNRSEIIFTAECLKSSDLMKLEGDCLEMAYTPFKSMLLTNEQRQAILQKVSSASIKEMLMIQNEPNTIEAYSLYKPNTFLTFFLNAPATYRSERLNIYYPQEFLENLKNSWQISTFIGQVVANESLDKIQRSLLKISSDALNSQTLFYLALNHLRYGNKKEAMDLLEIANEKSKSIVENDKNHFWMYQISRDSRYLRKLQLSMDINIYTLYASEILESPLQNYFTSVEINSEANTKDLTDPFEWSEILAEIQKTPKEKLFELAKLYSSREMVPVQTMIIQRAYGYKMHGYVMPYSEYLTSLNRDDQALLYAIMRQESNFVPSALSRSFALGLMQLMPFVVDAIDKNAQEKIETYEEMFIPQKNIEYAIKHISWMKTVLSHPLFMAYAYNGGMGFLKRHLATGCFENAEYEPFLSMELMQNSESREYGKKVLANYVMYKKILGEQVSIVDLFDKLKDSTSLCRF